MPSLDGRRVVLGVCGGIAAYKAVEVCRRLVDEGAFVSPVMTDAATRFVGTATFDALGSEPARTSLWDGDRPIPHTSLGQQADLIVVAPATARLLAAYAHGLSHDLLTNVLIATRAPVVVAPAMHTEMWEHPAVQANLQLLRSRGVQVVNPESGKLAGGDVGVGRLAAPSAIVDAARAVLLGASSEFTGLRVLVTAGGTREPIDPVRYIGNRSSGKQGHALAEVARQRGAEVTLVTTAGLDASPGIRRVQVETAAEMAAAVEAHAPEADVVIMAAAVADFTPVAPADQKLKKRDGAPSLELRPTDDILASLGATRRSGQTLVGFAAETTDLASNAQEKLRSKGVDLLVANDVSAPGVGFEHDTNEVVVFGVDGTRQNVPLTNKYAVAAAVLDAVLAVRTSAV
ncbi:MAG: bifunctional phosphopantothenoylcysteine decarboxylase/phosphopantothenate--cysteine ligase CoaBC [Actinomycetes bacterium]